MSIWFAGNSTVLQGWLPAGKTTTFNGTAIDLNGYAGPSVFLVHSAAGGGTSPTMDVKIQDSADGSTGWADITGWTFTQIDDTAGGSLQKNVWDVDEAKRYIRFVGTLGGTTPSFASSACVLSQLKVTT